MNLILTKIILTVRIVKVLLRVLQLSFVLTVDMFIVKTVLNIWGAILEGFFVLVVIRNMTSRFIFLLGILDRCYSRSFFSLLDLSLASSFRSKMHLII
jgi:hypothetical protein